MSAGTRSRTRSLRRQLLVTQVAMVLPLIVVAVIGGLLLRTASAGYDRSRHRVEASTEITDLQTAIAAVQTKLTSADVVSGDPRALAGVTSMLAEVDGRFDTLLRTLPEQADGIAPVRHDWVLLKGFLVQYGAQTPQGRALTVDPRIFAQAMSAIGGRLSAVVSGLNVLAAANAAALKHDLAAAHERQRSQQVALIALAVLGLIAAVATARWLYRGITRPLAELREAARRIGDDDLTHPVPAGGTEELAEVARSFNAMAQRLAGSRELLQGRERWFRSLVESSSDVMAVTDAEGVVSFVTPSVERVLGHSPDAVRDSTILGLLHPDDAAHARVRLATAAGRPGPADAFACRIRHHDGDWRHVEIVANNQLDDPAIDALVLTLRDVTESQRLQEQLAHQAFHDDLTGLANRALFTDRLTHTLSRRAADGEQVAVLFLDLDDFKSVNDTLGHSAGDGLLRQITERLRALLREDTTAARLGGDEFAVLLDDVVDAAEAEAVAERLLAAIRRPVQLAGTEVFPRASAGVALGRPGACTAEELLRQADTAMYQAKSRGKDAVVAYTEELAEHALRRLELSAELRHAVARGELEVHYQPTVRLDTGTVAGVEALVRWHHPRYGAISPAEFIPLAEDSGAIVGIGRWVLLEACRQAARWPDGQTCPRTMSVNVSGRQLQHPALLRDVTEALAESGLPADRLVLEITESVVLQETAEIIERLNALKALGIRLAIDDFGTGYSSLSYLQRLPVDILKVDRSFITGMGDPDGLALASTILRLAQTLKLETVAEGVEKPDQVHLLRQLDCDLVQGFLYARPTPAGDLPEAVARIEQPVQEIPARDAGAAA